MSVYVPPRHLLHGVPLIVADCYAKPHFLATYTGRSVNSTRLFEDATCICCGKRATNAHHWPPKGTAATFKFRGERLRPALLAVCGSGTTGCHNDWHAGARFKALWKWDSEQFAQEWWEGELLSEFGEHSLRLYEFGCWELYDMIGGRIWRVRL